MGVPPMNHGQDARATLAAKGFCKSLYGEVTIGIGVGVGIGVEKPGIGYSAGMKAPFVSR